MNNIIRTAIGKGLTSVASFNRARARNAQGPHPFLTGIHAPLAQEFTLENLDVTGAIPPELEGMYLRNGPNPVAAPNPARYHWFTGDGMVHGIRLSHGKALWYRNRWVRSNHVSEVLGEPPAPGPRLMPDSAVNTNIIAHAGQIFALVEAGGTPVELNAELATLAHNDFEGTLHHAFSAHPHLDPESGELHAVCYAATEMNTVYHVVLGTDGKVRREEPIAVEHGPSIHDCAITARFVLVFDLPVTFSMPAMLAGYEFPYRWNPEHQARLGLLPRDGQGGDIIWCAVEPCYAYHVCNAYDLADGRVVADVIVHNRNSYRDFRGPDAEDIRFERWTADPLAKAVTRRVIDTLAQEFPRFDERRTGAFYRYAYSVAIKTGGAANEVSETAILKYDLQTGARETHDFGAGCHPGEFVFVPRGAAEDDGWLIGLVTDINTHTSRLAILAAWDFTAPPVASVLIPHRIPPGFHGNWIKRSLF